MMTDRELLELAAKAVGIYQEPVFYSNDGVISFGNKCTEWDPLNEDGDALRLAVKLRLEVAIHENYSGVINGNLVGGLVPHGDDPCAATRRAIVRASAEIGKETK